MAATSRLSLCIANAPLFRLVGEFNQCPAEYVHESRRAEFCPAGMPPGLWGSARARRHLSQHILRSLGLAPCVEPDRPEWPLALLAANRLRKLALHVAAAVASVQVRRCLSRDDVIAWRDWLSPEPFAFAQHTGGLLPKLADGLHVDRSVPAESLGMSWLACSALGWPAGIAGRFVLKMPRADAELVCPAGEALAAQLTARVLSIVEPRWCSSFANQSV